MSRRLLAEERLAAACRFLEETARPLEAARFRFHFRGGSRDAVLVELRRFQNDDGGFGHALEPDLRAPESSAIATSVALRILRELEAAHDGALAGPALAWLLDRFDPDMGGWRIVPPTTDRSPHAPWWQQEGRDHGYDAFSLNPSAELLGYLVAWREVVPAAVLDRVGDAVRRELAGPGTVEMHDLLCCLRLHATEDLPADLARALHEKIVETRDATVVRDPAAWSTYGLRPLQVADGPASPFLSGLEEAVERNLDYEIDTQQPDGSWAPSWSWGDVYPDVWKKARREWSGVLTLRMLRVLRRFGRLPDV